MVLGGASTVGVVEDESLRTNVQGPGADLHIKTGGQGKPTAPRRAFCLSSSQFRGAQFE